MNDGTPTPEEMDTWLEQYNETREYAELLAEQQAQDDADERDAAIEELWQREAHDEMERDTRHLWATR